MTFAECKKFRDAAYSWAWHKGWKVSVNRVRVGPDTWENVCMLRAKVIIRDYD